MKNIELLLARRTARSQGGERGVVMTRIATITVAMGLAVMILTLAVFQGFRKEITADFRGFAADIAVVDISGFGRSEAQPMQGDAELKEWIDAMEQVRSVEEYATVGCMIKSGDRVVGVQLKGVGSGYDTAWWSEKIEEGSLPDLQAEARSKQLLISRSTARSLEVEVGDKLELLFVDAGSTPRRDSFRVAGIYSTGMEEMDRVMVLSDVRDVRRLAEWDTQTVMGYDVMLHDEREAEAVAEQIDEKIAELDSSSGMTNALAATIQMRHPVVFDWMQAHTVIAQAVLIIMMVVLLFNVAATMLIMVFDRIGMIGALKAMGMRNKAVARVFLYRAAMLFMKGAAWGNAIGLAAAVVQMVWHPIRLDPEGYMLSTLPISIGWGWLVALNIGAAAVTVAVMVLPSMMVTRIKTEESLKYKL